MEFKRIEWSHLIEVKRLRAGGMASLYLMNRITETGFCKRVVLKRIHERWSNDPLTRGLFIKEAQIHAALDHPNVVQLFDFGNNQEVLWMALEYINGGDLCSLAQSLNTQTREQKAMISLQALNEMGSALSHVHETVIHEDISPSNILYSKNGFFKLCDFGVARSKDSNEPSQRETGLGKFRYMAPEKICNATADERSDIFSLGVSIAEFYAGRKLYGEMSPEDLLRLIRQGGYFKHIVSLDLPTPLREIIYRAVQPAAHDRFQSARELLETVIWAQTRMVHKHGPYTLAMALSGDGPRFPSPALTAGEAVQTLVMNPILPKDELRAGTEQSQGWAKVISIILTLPVLLILPWVRRFHQGPLDRSRDTDPTRPGESSTP